MKQGWLLIAAGMGALMSFGAVATGAQRFGASELQAAGAGALVGVLYIWSIAKAYERSRKREASSRMWMTIVRVK